MSFIPYVYDRPIESYEELSMYVDGLDLEDRPLIELFNKHTGLFEEPKINGRYILEGYGGTFAAKLEVDNIGWGNFSLSRLA